MHNNGLLYAEHGYLVERQIVHYLHIHCTFSISASWSSMSLTEHSSIVHRASTCLRPSSCLAVSETNKPDDRYFTHVSLFSVAFLSPLAGSPTIGYRWTRYRKPLMTPNEMNLRTSMPPSTLLFSSIHCRNFLPCRREQYNSNKVAKTGRLTHPAKC